MNQSTAGKGPGLVLRAENHSGALRLSYSLRRRRALLEVLTGTGEAAAVGLSADELHALAKALLKVASALQTFEDETERLEATHVR